MNWSIQGKPLVRLCVLISFVMLTTSGTQLIAIADAQKDQISLFSKAAKDRGIRVTVCQSPLFLIDSYKRRITADAPREIDVQRHLDLILPELLLYPREFWLASEVSEFTFCRNLKKDGYPMNAVVDDIAGKLYFNVEAREDDLLSLSKSFHHEVFHVVNKRIDGSNELWKQFANPNLPYWNNTSLHKELGIGTPEEAWKGYLLQYSRVNASEDKAVLFQELLTNYDWVMYRAQFDPLIALKVRSIKSLLRVMSNSVNDEFWTRIAIKSQTRISHKSVREKLEEQYETNDRLVTYFAKEMKFSKALLASKRKTILSQILFGANSPESMNSLRQLIGLFEKVADKESALTITERLKVLENKNRQ